MKVNITLESQADVDKLAEALNNSAFDYLFKTTAPAKQVPTPTPWSLPSVANGQETKPPPIISKGQLSFVEAMDLSLSTLCLPKRAENALIGWGVLTVGDLCIRTETELMRFKNLGYGSLQLVKAALSELGLKLAEQPSV